MKILQCKTGGSDQRETIKTKQTSESYVDEKVKLQVKRNRSNKSTLQQYLVLRKNMDGLKPENVLKFMNLVNNLKHNPRRGWALIDVENHENIAGHMYAMGMMTFLIGDDSNLDRFKCLQLALVHDLAECIVGDITPHDNIPEDKKHALEDEAMKEITSHLGDDIGKMMYNLYKEYEAKETPEAIFVKDLDRLDMLFTATHYEKRDKTPKKMQEFFDATQGKFKHPFIQKVVKALYEYREVPDQLQGSVPNSIQPNGQ